MQFVKKFWKRQDTLERKLFWTILVVVSAATISSAVFTVYEGLSYAASLCSIGCAIVCVLVGLIAVKTSLYSQCYLVMCCILSCFLLPLLFLFCGGITSGMPLYFISSVVLLAYSDRKVGKSIAFAFSLVIQVSVLVASWNDPSLVIVTLDRDSSYLDFAASSVVNSLTLFLVAAFAMGSYSRERTKKEALLAKLDYLSMRDPLTEIYNRRYLMNYLENVVWHRRNDFCLLMFDIDDFKRVNDYCGHMFGDQVVTSVAKLLKGFCDSSTEGCVARYGGETFVYIYRAGSEVDAVAKSETVRKGIAQLRWEKFPQVHVTVSGGLVNLGSHVLKDVGQALAMADGLVKQAKSKGKNQVCEMT